MRIGRSDASDCLVVFLDFFGTAARHGTRRRTHEYWYSVHVGERQWHSRPRLDAPSELMIGLSVSVVGKLQTSVGVAHIRSTRVTSVRHLAASTAITKASVAPTRRAIRSGDARHGTGESALSEMRKADACDVGRSRRP